MQSGKIRLGVSSSNENNGKKKMKVAADEGDAIKSLVASSCGDEKWRLT